MPFLFRRIFETFIVEGVFSAAFTFLYRFGVLTSTEKSILITMCFALGFNFICLFIFARGYIFSVKSLKAYYSVNITVMALLTVASVVLAYIDVEPIFTWAFFPFKLFQFWFDMPKALSAAAVGGLFIFATAIMPIFVRKPVNIYEKPKD